jgi:hypothetical protein
MRRGHAPGVAVLVELAHEGAVRKVELLFLASHPQSFVTVQWLWSARDGAFAPAAMGHDMREGDADEQKVDGMEAPHGLAVWRTVLGRFNLFDGAALRVWQMTRTADAPCWNESKGRTSLLLEVLAIIFRNQSRDAK